MGPAAKGSEIARPHGWVQKEAPAIADLVPAEFLHRPHRFGAWVRTPLGDRYVHVPASGRLRELLYPGNQVLVALGSRPGGRTAGRLLFARGPGVWVSIDTQVPARLAAQMIRDRAFPPLAAYTALRSEVAYAGSRIDFQLEGATDGRPPCLLEVKSVTLVEDGTALFPDAPTARGTRHLRTLTQAVAEGLAAAVLFLVQRPDARRFAPHAQNDPAFAAALRAAAAAGVAVYALPCQVDPPRVAVEPDRPLSVDL